ncbi:hypothetical protein [Streptomyces sp. NPDC056512]|uniref:hypothetical protein n=1 Tax=Streptomyces sp. NPDC056512 TaxID=3345846 RepID=UPI0036AAE137
MGHESEKLVRPEVLNSKMDGMETLSWRTLARTINLGIEFEKSDLRTMLMEANLGSGRVSRDVNKQEMLRTAMTDARESALDDDDADAHRGLLDFIEVLVKKAPSHRPHLPSLLDDLSEALRVDGYELFEHRDLDDPHDPFRVTRVELLPVDPSEVPLREETTALERDLAARGYTNAMGHYKLARKHLAEQEHPSANSQLRTAFEDLVVRLAIDHTDYSDSGRAGQGGMALAKLYVKDAGRRAPVPGEPLPQKEGGDFIQGLWDMSHRNGSHPGLSDAQEARIRMMLFTGAMLLLLRHFPANP